MDPLKLQHESTIETGNTKSAYASCIQGRPWGGSGGAAAQAQKNWGAMFFYRLNIHCRKKNSFTILDGLGL
jgi:hypothetical protein